MELSEEEFFHNEFSIDINNVTKLMETLQANMIYFSQNKSYENASMMTEDCVQLHQYLKKFLPDDNGNYWYQQINFLNKNNKFQVQTMSTLK
jgi:hypothetical protein